MKNKIIITLISAFALLSLTNSAFSQAKKPTIMVVPDDDWMLDPSRNYTMSFDDEGNTKVVMDYKKALQLNSELNGVMAKIGELFVKRGYPLVDLKSMMDKIETDKARTGVSKIQEDPIDLLSKTAKADITLKLFWKINSIGPKRSVEFRLKGIDSYSSKLIASASGTGPQSFTPETSILLSEAVNAYLDNFTNDLNGHFENLITNGREGSLVVLVRKGSEINLDTKVMFNGKENMIKDLVNRYWMPRNTVNKVFSMDENSPQVLKFSQVKIPLYGDDGFGGEMAYDFATWGDNLRIFLDETLKVKSSLRTKGLGEVEIIIE